MLLRRARPVGRQFQQRRGPVQRCLPVAACCCSIRALQPAAAARRRSRRTGSPAPAGDRLRRRRRRSYRRAQFADQHTHRPAVGDDVVHGEQQHVLRPRPAGSARPRISGPCARSKGAPASSHNQPLQFRLASSCRRRSCSMSSESAVLPWSAICCTGSPSTQREGGAQRFMPRPGSGPARGAGPSGPDRPFRRRRSGM